MIFRVITFWTGGRRAVRIHGGNDPQRAARQQRTIDRRIIVQIRQNGFRQSHGRPCANPFISMDSRRYHEFRAVAVATIATEPQRHDVASFDAAADIRLLTIFRIQKAPFVNPFVQIVDRPIRHGCRRPRIDLRFGAARLAKRRVVSCTTVRNGRHNRSAGRRHAACHRQTAAARPRLRHSRQFVRRRRHSVQ